MEVEKDAWEYSQFLPENSSKTVRPGKLLEGASLDTNQLRRAVLSLKLPLFRARTAQLEPHARVAHPLCSSTPLVNSKVRCLMCERDMHVGSLNPVVVSAPVLAEKIRARLGL